MHVHEQHRKHKHAFKFDWAHVMKTGQRAIVNEKVCTPQIFAMITILMTLLDSLKTCKLRSMWYGKQLRQEKKK